MKKGKKIVAFLLAAFMLSVYFTTGAAAEEIDFCKNEEHQETNEFSEANIIARALVCDCGGTGRTTRTGVRFTELGTCSDNSKCKHYYRDTIAYQSCQSCGKALGEYVQSRVHYCEWNGDNPTSCYYY